jgi:hypothetical protein
MSWNSTFPGRIFDRSLDTFSDGSVNNAKPAVEIINDELTISEISYKRVLTAFWSF